MKNDVDRKAVGFFCSHIYPSWKVVGGKVV